MVEEAVLFIGFGGQLNIRENPVVFRHHWHIDKALPPYNDAT
jgi:hypothetical protein